MNKDLSFTKTITVNAPVEKVWQALTQAEQVKEYFFGTDLETDWSVGGPIKFKGEWEGKPYEDKGTVQNYEENRTLTYSYWSNFSGTEDTEENYSNITYSVNSNQDGTTELTFTQSGFDDEAARDRSEANWGQVMENLKQMVEANS